MNPLLQDVIKLKKVGPKSKEALNKLGILRISDLLHYYPRTYEKVEGITPIGNLLDNQEVYIKGCIVSSVHLSRFGKKAMVQCFIEDETGRIKLVFFNQPYIKNALDTGETYIIKGKYIIKNSQKMIANPRIIKEKEFDKLTKIKLKPIYPLSKTIGLKQLTGYVDQSLEIMKYDINDYLGESVRKELNLATLSFAYEKIHYPLTEKNLEIARRRLAFDEFFLFQMAMKHIREQVKKSKNAFRMKKVKEVTRYINELPFQLTNAQQKALEDIFKDFSCDYTMTRLIQGDVGSGKTVIAAIALLNTAISGFQGALMAPTEVLAKQHYNSLKKQFEPYNVQVGLLIGSTTQKQKKEIYDQLRLGQIHIIIGTHTLIQEKVAFANLGLVVTDEQHRFGVVQRETLVNKGRFPHTLVMSATPIPRTLALIIYGDLDISVVAELPAGRQTIETYLVNSSYHQRLYRFVEKEVEAGHNVYFVCPMVEDQEEESNLMSVESFFETLQENLNPSIRIEKLNGRMKGNEKNEIINRFLTFDTQVLVSTTVIEVGVNIPNATLMVIENAERFGLAQLHQLRGRVGRSDLKSYCVLVTDTKSHETKKKLSFLKEHNDGFAIAEYDLKTRGPGEAFGTHQHGIPFFKLANIYEDKELLDYATVLARDYTVDASLKMQLELLYCQLDKDIGL